MNEESKKLENPVLVNEFSFLEPEADIAKLAAPVRECAANSVSLRAGMSELSNVLKLMGYSSLRAGQDRAIYNLMSQRDTICILPTSHGKSSVYIIPTMCLKWRTLIFSPLVSLMKDQVESLWRSKFTAAQISSGQTQQENQMAQLAWESGELQFLLVAPERLNNESFVNSMIRYKPDMICVDEAHALSSWGDSFRPSYLKIGTLISSVNPKVVLGLTATATSDVEADIRRILGIQSAAKVVYYPARRNLKLRTLAYSERKFTEALMGSEGPTIVYCATRKATESLYNHYKDVIPGGALVYNGGMTSDERTANQNMFMTNDVRVMFATNAFGLGVNKSDIRCIIHRDVPASVEAVTQEQGRAGRDGKDSQCILFLDPASRKMQEWMIRTTYPDMSVLRTVFFNMRQKADAGGFFQLTIDDLAASIGIDSKTCGSACGILTAAKIIDRAKADENPTRVLLIKDHADPDFQKYIDLVRTVGKRSTDGAFEFMLSAYLNQGRLKPKKTLEIFKQLDANGYIAYTKPFRGSTTHIIGDLSLLDVERYNKRRDMAYEKLERVWRYADLPDDQKHDFLRKYFGFED